MKDRTLIDPDLLIAAYKRGLFPMAEERGDEGVFWVDPPQRCVIPLEKFHLSRRLGRTVRTTRFRLTADAAFARVIEACAGGEEDRPRTWINSLIERSYVNLHARGNAHSIEVWEGDELVGGLYGVSIGAAFFGESMFHRRPDASKIALVHLVARLKAGGYRLLDAQLMTSHLAQFGAAEISRRAYRARLSAATSAKADFYVLGGAGAAVLAGAVLQLITHTS